MFHAGGNVDFLANGGIAVRNGHKAVGGILDIVKVAGGGQAAQLDFLLAGQQLGDDGGDDGAAALARVREYHLTFEDEGHILLIVPQEGSIRFCYAIGADANKVINSEAMDYLIKNVRHSRDGEYWKQQLYDFTDELVKND